MCFACPNSVYILMRTMALAQVITWSTIKWNLRCIIVLSNCSIIMWSPSSSARHYAISLHDHYQRAATCPSSRTVHGDHCWQPWHEPCNQIYRESPPYFKAHNLSPPWIMIMTPLPWLRLSTIARLTTILLIRKLLAVSFHESLTQIHHVLLGCFVSNNVTTLIFSRFFLARNGAIIVTSDWTAIRLIYLVIFIDPRLQEHSTWLIHEHI